MGERLTSEARSTPGARRPWVVLRFGGAMAQVGYTPAVKLAVSRVTAPGVEQPDQWVLVLHGILGRRTNWRTIARKWVRDCPGWGALCVDLRMHGDSQKGFDPPHTVQAAARDLDELTGTVAEPIGGVLGHSFGGKVALAYAEAHPHLQRIWVVDSTPGPRPDGVGSESTLAVLDMLRSLPAVYDERDHFIDAVLQRDFSEALAKWLAMNLSRDDSGQQVLMLDLDAIRALLHDYFRTDLWHVLENHAHDTEVHCIVGGVSSMFTDDDRQRLQRAAAANLRIHMHTIADAGHWVHADAPVQLVELLRRTA